MISLTFGEQVKIVLSRKGMTIKELAEQIEAKTGRKMSRQNLTQRLGRDNFQEQDMRMIAEILGCSFQLSILASLEAAERASVIEEVPPTSIELDKLTAKKEMKAARAEAKDKAEKDLTVGEFVDMMVSVGEAEEGETVPEDIGEKGVFSAEEMWVPDAAVETKEYAAQTVTEPNEKAEETKQYQEKENAAQDTEQTEVTSQINEGNNIEQTENIESAENEGREEAVRVKESQPQKKEEKGSRFSKITRIVSAPKKKEQPEDFQPIKKRVDEDEDLVNGDVNPYTGHEYQTNSVRMHPKRIGYVQVYDRKEHKWTDMTEWAFLGYEERKKATQGKDYEPPIYLD